MKRERPMPILPRRQAGFTLVEMLVSLAVTVLLLLAVLTTFDLNNRVAKVQTNVADMQQSLRVAQDDVVRLVRMAGCGGLPLDASPNRSFPNGVAISIQDNVPSNTRMVAADPATLVLPGTDVLTVRGVFSKLYQVRITDPVKLDSRTNPTNGTVTLRPEPRPHVLQDLTPLRDALGAGTQSLLLISSLSDTVFAVVNTGGFANNPDGSLDVNFNVPVQSLTATGTFPPDFQSAAFVGILEEHRYYVREDHVVPTDLTSDLAPKLTRGRFVPGTNQPYQGDPSNARLDLADNILDLQVALGFDSLNGGARGGDLDNDGPDDQILETADGKNDDWYLNSAGEGPLSGALQYLRVSTVARTDRRDFQYQAPLLPARIEDRAYAATDPRNALRERTFRWRTLRTVIDLRNL